MYEVHVDYDDSGDFLWVKITNPDLWTIWKEIMSMLSVIGDPVAAKMTWTGLRYLMRLNEGDIPISVDPEDWSKHANPLPPPDPAEVEKAHEVLATVNRREAARCVS